MIKIHNLKCRSYRSGVNKSYIKITNSKYLSSSSGGSVMVCRILSYSNHNSNHMRMVCEKLVHLGNGSFVECSINTAFGKYRSFKYELSHKASNFRRFNDYNT